QPPRGFIDAFAALIHLPRGFWVVVLTFVFEAMAYFAALTLMSEFLSQDLKWGDEDASRAVSFFTALVTLFMLGAGSYAESFGLRRALLAAMVLCALGRLIYAIGPGAVPIGPGSAALTAIVILLSLLIIALGEAVLQPVCYSGVKQFTDERTSSMGYGLIYALMNGGIVVGAAISSYLRPSVQKVLSFRAIAATQPTTQPDDATKAALGDSITGWFASFSPTGIQAVNWVCFGISVLTLVFVFMFFTRRQEARRVRPDAAEAIRKSDTRPLGARLRSYFADGPFSNVRFIFFIFMLLPVRTLFAHQWLTLPQYVLRAYSQEVADKMEWIANAINPAIIFVGVPVLTALTRRANVYTMMIIGTLVSAAPTFLLCSGPNLWLLITYIVIFSIGEALWSARFLEYASELAPEGRIAQYMGLANIPWLLAKATTGLYSGVLLARYCPPNTPVEQLHTGTLWFIYGCVAMASPIGLILARRWVIKGLHTRPAA
ncbi:MAG: MFS transporter, partial [Planctomycetes bacterium]|nr:MFS transporter [Planctomycetota bacterium]